MKFCFSVYDMNGDGFIGRCEDAFIQLSFLTSLTSKVACLAK